jgi:phage repressor protein C with HTH and peptisase S24 domain
MNLSSRRQNFMKNQSNLHEELRSRLQEIKERKDESLSALARRSGVDQGNLSNIASGKLNVGIINTTKILQAFNAVVLFPDQVDDFVSKRATDPETVFIPRVKAKPRAGTGGLETDGDFVGRYAFHRSFIKRKQGTEDSMKIFEVAGDSMEPTLREGDLVMINENSVDIKTGSIYLVTISDELMIKRIENRGEMLKLISDNQRYEPILVDMKAEDIYIKLHGRMVWSCREY